MKYLGYLTFVFMTLNGCATRDEIPFYERDYALPSEALEWAKTAPLADLCQGTKNWRIDSVREAALREIKERGLNTKECYYTGMQLTP